MTGGAECLLVAWDRLCIRHTFSLPEDEKCFQKCLIINRGLFFKLCVLLKKMGYPNFSSKKTLHLEEFSPSCKSKFLFAGATILYNTICKDADNIIKLFLFVSMTKVGYLIIVAKYFDVFCPDLTSLNLLSCCSVDLYLFRVSLVSVGKCGEFGGKTACFGCVARANHLH